MADAVIEVRQRHRTWGPCTIMARLEAQHADQALPAASTIGAVFDRARLAHRRDQVEGPTSVHQRGLAGEPVVLFDLGNDVQLNKYGPVVLGTLQGEADCERIRARPRSRPAPYRP